jgi:hypothetical protein
MNTDVIHVRPRRDLNGKDISKEWTVLMADAKISEKKYQKSKQNLFFIVGHVLLYGVIVMFNLKK